VFTVFSSLVLLCVFLCRSVLFTLVRQPSDWLGRLHSCDIFHVEGFPLQRQIEELFAVLVYCIYSQHVTLSTFSRLISFF